MGPNQRLHLYLFTLDYFLAGESASGTGSQSVAGIVGSSVRIYGTQFSESPQDNVASLGGFPCNVFESSGTWIDCTVSKYNYLLHILSFINKHLFER